jgi:hypothetical protein
MYIFLTWGGISVSHILKPTTLFWNLIIMPMYAFLFNWPENVKLPRNIQEIYKNYLSVSTDIIVFLKKSYFFVLKTKSHSVK